MPRGKHNPRTDGGPEFPQRRGRGQQITLPEKEVVYQSWLALGSKKAVSRTLNMSYQTVCKIIKEMQRVLTPQEQKERSDAIAGELAGKFYQSTQQILDSIKPDDLKSGRLPLTNAKGEIVGYKDYGPSVLQKATAAGIFTDKIRILRDLERAAAEDQGSGQLLMPDSVEQLLSAIRGKIQSISVLNVNFRQDNPELSTRLDKVMEVSAVESTPDETLVENDFRNPGE